MRRLPGESCFNWFDYNKGAKSIQTNAAQVPKQTQDRFFFDPYGPSVAYLLPEADFGDNKDFDSRPGIAGSIT